MSNYFSVLDPTEIFALIFLTIMFTIVTLGMVLNLKNEATKELIDTKEVDCFDRLNNKIVGEVCLEKVYCGNIDYYFKSKGCEVKQ